MRDAAVVGVVVIGRNEGERLVRCLESLTADRRRPLVYVDSDSTDGSPARAAVLGAEVVALDLRRPFTAARARNEGFARLLELAPDVTLVQFVDGDCVVDPDWMEAAAAFLQARPEVAVVCGRRRERFPERSVYNRLCDQEWNTPVGEARSCGGDAMMRRSALEAVGGYRQSLIAGEEPELCVRFRAAGWSIWRLDREMTLHDVAMTRFGQWWKRAQRAGHAFAEGAKLHGAPPERHWVRETRSAWAWGLVLPATLLLSALVWSPWWLLGFAVYPLQVTRLAMKSMGAPSLRWSRATYLVLGKFAEAVGVLQFHARRWRGTPSRLIEYK